jgi:hypothetical protein
MVKEADNLLEKQKKYFTLIGLTVYESQCIEHKLKMLSKFMPLPYDKFHITKEEFLSRETFLEKRTLGFVISELKKRSFTLNDDAEFLINKFVIERNTVVHHLVKLPGFNVNTEEGIDKGIKFLDEYRKTIQVINDIFDPILISVHIVLCENTNIDDINLYQEKMNKLYCLLNDSLKRAGGYIEIEIHDNNNIDERFDSLIKNHLNKNDSSALNPQEEKKKLWKKTKIIQALSRIAADIANQDGWIALSVCEQRLKTECPEIKPDDYGFNTILEIIKICNLFEIKKSKHKKQKISVRFHQERNEIG